MIFLIGAGGYLGSILCKHFASLGLDVFTISRTFQWKKLPSESRLVSEVSTINNYINKINDSSLLIYMAGSTDIKLAEESPSKDLSMHIHEMESLFFAMRINSIRPTKFIFMSSAGAIYGDSECKKKSENDILCPKSAYGKRNLLLEVLVSTNCRLLNIDYSCLRVSNPYGSTQYLFKRKGLIQSLIRSSITKELITLRGDGKQKRDYIHASDFCRILENLINCPSLPSRLNICSGLSLSSLDVVNILKDFNLSPNFDVISFQPSYEVKDSLLDNNRVFTLLNQPDYKFVTVKDFASNVHILDQSI